MNFNITIEKDECIALYSYLKCRENDLSAGLLATLQRLEAVVFDHLSIEDVERMTLRGGESDIGGKK